MLEIDYVFAGESGTARASVAGHGWVLFIGPIDYLASVSRIPPSIDGTLRATARRTGFHEIRVYLNDAVGTIEADWRVVNGRTTGRMMRGARFILALYP